MIDRVSIEDFLGADPSGTTYSDAALAAALNASNHVIVPAKKEFEIGNGGPFKLTGDNKTIECAGGGRQIASGGVVMLDIYGRNFTAKNLNAVGYLCAISALQFRAAGQVTGGRFEGDWIYPLAFAADGCVAKGLTIDGSRAFHMNAAILMQSCDSMDLSNFTIDNYQGFGIHLLNQTPAHPLSKGWSIRNGHILGRRRTLTATARSGQTVFEFSTARRTSRFGVQVNSAPVDAKSYQLADQDGSQQHFRLTLPNIPAGATVSLHANASLEAVNIGSKVANGRVASVMSEEAGDSGLVICDDDNTGCAWGVSFESCEARSALYAGFAETSTGTRQNRYIGCSAVNVGQALNAGQDAIYSSGFMLSGSSGEIGGGRVSNDARHPTARYGVFFNGNSAAVGPGRPWRMTPPVFAGSFSKTIYYG